MQRQGQRLIWQQQNPLHIPQIGGEGTENKEKAMMRLVCITLPLLLSLTVPLSSCAQFPQQSPATIPKGAANNAPRMTAPETEEVAVIRALTAAFNAHDPAAMRQYWHEDVQWLDPLATQAPPLYSTAAALEADMVSYFKSLPDVTTTLESISATGAWVTAIERPTWTGKDGTPKTQASIAVYEVIEGKIKRFWYFPSTE